MPQFDPSSFASQLVWLAITFVALYFIMVKVAIPRIGEVLDERQRRIDDDLERAAKLKDEAEAAVAAYEAALAEARAQAQKEIRDAQEKVAKETAKRNAALSEKLNKQIEDGEKRIQEAKTQALDSVREIAVDVAKATTEKLVGSTVDEKALEAAVGKAMKETA